MENITALIKARRSVRTFDGRALEKGDREKLAAFVETVENPYGIPLRFKFLEGKENGLVCPVMRGTDLYIAAGIGDVPRSEEAFGYSFEKMVLFAQSLGIGTVWLGGTMNREAFEAAMDLDENEKMPCATPLGYPAERMAVKETMMRKAIHADSRLPFSSLFFDGGFGTPLTEEKAGILAMPLEMVRWAPSAVNKQPWRAIVTENAVHFYVHHSGSFLREGVGDMQKIDMGIALCHFELAAREAGLAPTFVIDDPGIPAEGSAAYIASYRL